MNVPRLRAVDFIDPETGACYIYISDVKEANSIPHCHDFFEIMLVVSGKAVHIINGQEKQLNDGALIFIRPDDIHSFRELDGFDCQYINIAFPMDTLHELSDFLGDEFPKDSLLSAPEAPSVHLSDIEKNILWKKFENLYVMPVSRKKYIRLELRAMLVYIMTSYFIVPAGSVPESVPLWLEELCTVMNTKENFLKGIDIMKNLSGKSHEHLCRAFKKYYSTTPTDFINDLKLNYSANLLINTSLSILDVSADAGYESLSRFYCLFKGKFGMTPGDYRKQKQKAVI